MQFTHSDSEKELIKSATLWPNSYSDVQFTHSFTQADWLVDNNIPHALQEEQHRDCMAHENQITPTAITTHVQKYHPSSTAP